ncbi:thiamine-phosphate kinase [Roseomonas sp. SSH11]|uniref:Thiamine-monophosphate kinase n=1 Tax=Pararoseomonas baculiformis TaxID=2820812 RepID=A0ABS4AFG7_9PROT|nr:thiamine-phosphate kinase [Pararoseomonas baculiformis]MBP0445785.1 thiamine-phosphate kinase [Pararoseomonas baculiformis]
MSLPPEFALIARHFRGLAGEGALDLSDDAALLAPPPGRELVLAADAMVEGVHYLPDDPPETIGRKLLRVNLSDLAAMGAEPLAYLMTTALPRGTTAEWLEGFAAGLAADQREFGLQVLGGDTVSIPGPACLSLTILGTVPPGLALRRNGARAGDDLWVSGTIGDGALGLAVLQGRAPADAAGHLARRYRLPEPRLALGRALRGLAHAAMDVSDGLAQDLGHLCRASNLGAMLELGSIPLSEPARGFIQDDATWLPRLATGGDDYELLFAADPADAARILAAADAAGTPVARIGRFTLGAPGVTVLGPDGQAMALPRGGWSHF